MPTSLVPRLASSGPKKPPMLVARALRVAVVGLLAASWWGLVNGGFASALTAVHAQLGNWPAAVAVVLTLSLFLMLTTGRVALWLWYRPAASLAEGELPTVTAIVPAYNEGPMVRHALLSLVAQNYPAHKLQIIAVDDGSRDETYAHMEAAARMHPGRILLLRLSQNRGKRAALQAGFHAARSTLVLTCDSDCVLAPDAVREMAAPFADARVGAVAGRVLIHNKAGSWLTRLLSPQFTMTFDFLRAAQSVNGTVLCCPGALSAFRLDAVMKVLPAWLDQRFLGVRVGPGEDRFLTTLILREGYLSRYQATARVHTLVPTDYAKVCRMLLRWDRCDLRESLDALWTWPKRAGLGRLALVAYLAFAVETVATVPFTVFGILATLALAAVHPLAALSVVVGFNASLGVSLLLCLSSDFSLETLLLFGYAWFSPALSWILPYAALTMNDQAWMSRELPHVAPSFRAAA